MANYGKWIGGGLGWAFGGPIGMLIGFGLGSLLDNGSTTGQTSRGESRPGRTVPSDFPEIRSRLGRSRCGQLPAP